MENGFPSCDRMVISVHIDSRGLFWAPAQELGVWVGCSGTGVGQGGVSLSVAVLVDVW